MIVEYKEIFKLKVMLDENHIPYEFLDRSSINYENHELMYPFYQIIVYNPNGEFNDELENFRLISVIEGHGTYGENLDLLEIQGCLTSEEEKEDSVKGYLRAEEVFKRIKKNYYKMLNGDEE